MGITHFDIASESIQSVQRRVTVQWATLKKLIDSAAGLLAMFLDK